MRRRLLTRLLWLAAAVAACLLLFSARALLGAGDGELSFAKPAHTIGGDRETLRNKLGEAERREQPPEATEQPQTHKAGAGYGWPPEEKPGLRCLSGVVTVAPGGRLGNLVMEYASAWALSQQYGLRFAAPTDLLISLRNVFQSLSAPPLNTLLNESRCKPSRLNEGWVLQQTVNDFQLRPVSRYVSWATNHSQPVILRRFIQMIRNIAEMSLRLLDEFHYKREHAQAAAQTLDDVKRRMARRVGPSYSKILMVGIHVRRKDYDNYLLERFDAKNVAGVGYYQRAAQRMRELLRPEGAALAFVVVSDDVEWCKQVLTPALQQDFQTGDPMSGVFLASPSGDQSPVLDLALLSSVDHSIFAYGTFGVWSALMAGGRTIVFDLASANPRLRSRTRTSAMVFVQYLPSWEMLT